MGTASSEEIPHCSWMVDLTDGGEGSNGDGEGTVPAKSGNVVGSNQVGGKPAQPLCAVVLPLSIGGVGGRTYIRKGA